MRSAGIALEQCWNCRRMKSVTGSWQAMQWGSPRFLELCVQHWKGDKQVVIQGANLLYSQPHRHKFCLSVRYTDTENCNTVVWYSVIESICNDCTHFMQSGMFEQQCGIVTISDCERQSHVDYLLTEITKANFGERVSPNQFLFRSKAPACRLVNFIQALLAVRVDEERVPVGEGSGIQFMHNYCIECPKISQHDLVVMPPRYGNDMICLCLRSDASLKFWEPLSGRLIEMSASEYWNDPFEPVKTKDDAEEFCIASITPVGVPCGRYQNCILNLINKSDNGYMLHTYSHFNVTARVGDCVRCYNLGRYPIEDLDRDDVIVFYE